MGMTVKHGDPVVDALERIAASLGELVAEAQKQTAGLERVHETLRSVSKGIAQIRQVAG